MNCKNCGNAFEPEHFNQQLCSDTCKIAAARKRSARYKKTLKGHATEMRWRKNPKKRKIDRTYYTSAKGRSLAVVRQSRYVREKWWVGVQKRLRDTVPYKQLRQYLIDRIGVCQACGSSDDLTIDHIVPMALGGAHEISNVQLLCRGCNARKKQRVIRYELPY